MNHELIPMCTDSPDLTWFNFRFLNLWQFRGDSHSVETVFCMWLFSWANSMHSDLVSTLGSGFKPQLQTSYGIIRENNSSSAMYHVAELWCLVGDLMHFLLTIFSTYGGSIGHSSITNWETSVHSRGACAWLNTYVRTCVHITKICTRITMAAWFITAPNCKHHKKSINRKDKWQYCHHSRLKMFPPTTKIHILTSWICEY